MFSIKLWLNVSQIQHSYTRVHHTGSYITVYVWHVRLVECLQRDSASYITVYVWHVRLVECLQREHVLHFQCVLLQIFLVMWTPQLCDGVLPMETCSLESCGQNVGLHPVIIPRSFFFKMRFTCPWDTLCVTFHTHNYPHMTNCDIRGQGCYQWQPSVHYSYTILSGYTRIVLANNKKGNCQFMNPENSPKHPCNTATCTVSMWQKTKV
jgi:hypothetical protein